MKNLPIAVVERETGLSKDTLRVWEKRYGFPRPDRDEFGERAYAADDLVVLRLLRRLIDAGHRPSKVVGLPQAELEALAKVSETRVEAERPPIVAQTLALLIKGDISGLRDDLSQRLGEMGLVDFIFSYLAPMLTAIGEAWARGELGVAQEHLFTEIITRILRTHLQQFPQRAAGGKRILFATLPGEQHGLGLLMAECIVSVKGHTSISLGTQVPINDLVWACESYRCDVVALSFSRARTAAFVSEGVQSVRALLPPKVALWVGGGGSDTIKNLPPGVKLFERLSQFQDVLGPQPST